MKLLIGTKGVRELKEKFKERIVYTICKYYVIIHFYKTGVARKQKLREVQR